MMRARWMIIFCQMVAIAVANATAVSVSFAMPQTATVTIEGLEKQAVIKALNESAISLAFDDEPSAEPVDVAIEQVSLIRFSDAVTMSRANRIRLVDGSVVMADQFEIDQDSHLTFSESNDTAAIQSLNTRNVDWVLMSPASADTLSRWGQFLESEQRAGDWLIIDREGNYDFVEGIIGQVTKETIGFTTDDRTAEAPRERVSGMAWFHAATRNLVEPVALLTTTSGSKFFIRRMQPTEADSPETFLIQLVCGESLILPSDEIETIDFSAVRFQYVSEMTPSTVNWDQLFVSPQVYDLQAKLNGPRFNQSHTNEILSLNIPAEVGAGTTLNRQEFTSGVAMKGGTRVVYPLGRRFSRLESWCGFAPDAPLDGLVEIVISGDGAPVYQRIWNNQTDTAELLDIDIQEVNRLTIEVRYHDGRNIGDVIHFCDLKVSR